MTRAAGLLGSRAADDAKPIQYRASEAVYPHHRHQFQSKCF